MSAIAGRMEVVRDADALARRAADIIAQAIKGASAPFRLVLSGGSTPRATYALLAHQDIDWSQVDLFFGDERFVPHDHKDSNYRMVCESLLAAGKVRPRNLFAIPADGTPQSAAARYDQLLRQQYGADALKPGVPLFHLTLLGLGDDGHTASLLPDQPVLEERSVWAAAVPKGRDEPRITLTYPALDASAATLFLVAGAAKREALVQARSGLLPAGGLQPMGDVLWLVDQAAVGNSF